MATLMVFQLLMLTWSVTFACRGKLSSMPRPNDSLEPQMPHFPLFPFASQYPDRSPSRVIPQSSRNRARTVRWNWQRPENFAKSLTNFVTSKMSHLATCITFMLTKSTSEGFLLSRSFTMFTLLCHGLLRQLGPLAWQCTQWSTIWADSEKTKKRFDSNFFLWWIER